MDTWGRISWSHEGHLETPFRVETKCKNVGQWSELLVVMNCLLNPNIMVDGESKKVTLVEHSGIMISANLVQTLDLDVIQHSLLQTIKHRSIGARTFNIEDDFVKQTLNILGMSNEKVCAATNQKHDIILHCSDSTSLKFNIKSLLGKQPSIINASYFSSIQYKVNTVLSINELNKTIAAIPDVSNKLKYLHSVGTIDYINFASTEFEKQLKKFNVNGDSVVAGWMLEYFSNRTQKFINQEDIVWFNKFIFDCMTQLAPKDGLKSEVDCGVAFLAGPVGKTKLLFTMGGPHFISNLHHHIRFDKPSFTKHHKYMLGQISNDYTFRLPLSIRLNRSISQLWDSQ